MCQRVHDPIDVVCGVSGCGWHEVQCYRTCARCWQRGRAKGCVDPLWTAPPPRLACVACTRTFLSFIHAMSPSELLGEVLCPVTLTFHSSCEPLSTCSCGQGAVSSTEVPTGGGAFEVELNRNLKFKMEMAVWAGCDAGVVVLTGVADRACSWWHPCALNRTCVCRGEGPPCECVVLSWPAPFGCVQLWPLRAVRERYQTWIKTSTSYELSRCCSLPRPFCFALCCTCSCVTSFACLACALCCAVPCIGVSIVRVSPPPPSCIVYCCGLVQA